jgi:hypothetical protein
MALEKVPMISRERIAEESGGSLTLLEQVTPLSWIAGQAVDGHRSQRPKALR